MHMADALISPVMGGTMWAATAGLIAYSAKKLKENNNDSKVPRMGLSGQCFAFPARRNSKPQIRDSIHCLERFRKKQLFCLITVSRKRKKSKDLPNHTKGMKLPNQKRVRRKDGLTSALGYPFQALLEERASFILPQK
jgi:hypothetical protein